MKRFMGGLHVSEPKALIDGNLHCSRSDYREKIVSRLLEFLRIAHVVKKCGSREKKRALLRQRQRLECRNRARGIAEIDEHAPDRETVEGAHKSVLTDGIVDHRH